ncbi:Oidioi.mRNA.OKI2018_I69.chr1.g1179.t1.cds [Oikopleura dioica]|uniref:Oidioi.mRNA.OKI2018_I69.chr1.g1179.t1.cds n=1 Tax=Oikopleura dioica TaxID=34765 RepID=A0ABN7SWC0_OIKDI|nr:Oidioi.mRNA.OKI2018_I69.chr1.g1179.t1.cds [Oikopleura dioica]
MRFLLSTFFFSSFAAVCTIETAKYTVNAILGKDGECDFENREIEEIVDYSFPSGLTSLNLRFNKLTSLNLTQMELKLEKLDVSYNELSSLDEVDLSSLEFLDVSSNNLTCIDFQELPKNILLHKNPISCDWETLKPYFDFSPDRRSRKGIEFVCETPEELAGRSISSLTKQDIQDLSSSCKENEEDTISPDEFCSYIGVIFVGITCTLVSMTGLFAFITYRNRNSPFWSLIDSSDQPGLFDMNYDGDRDSLAL